MPYTISDWARAGMRVQVMWPDGTRGWVPISVIRGEGLTDAEGAMWGWLENRTFPGREAADFHEHWDKLD